MRDLIGGTVAGRDGRTNLGGDDRFAGVKKKKRKKTRMETFNHAEQEGPGGGGRGPHGLAGISLHVCCPLHSSLFTAVSRETSRSKIGPWVCGRSVKMSKRERGWRLLRTAGFLQDVFLELYSD